MANVQGYEDTYIINSHLPLIEVEANGMGAAYEVMGRHIEPIGTYIGNDNFLGLHLEGRFGVDYLGVGQETHFDTLDRQGTLRPYVRLELATVNHEDRVEFTNQVVRYIHDYYTRLSQTQADKYPLTIEEILLKQSIYGEIINKLDREQAEIRQDGSIDLST